VIKSKSIREGECKYMKMGCSGWRREKGEQLDPLDKEQDKSEGQKLRRNGIISLGWKGLKSGVEKHTDSNGRGTKNALHRG